MSILNKKSAKISSTVSAGNNIYKREIAPENPPNDLNLNLNVNLGSTEWGTGQEHVTPEEGGGQHDYPQKTPPKDYDQSNVQKEASNSRKQKDIMKN